MISTGGNPDKRLELIQKTYHLQTTNNNIENSPPDRSLVAKVSSHQPSRKTSVHDVHEAHNDQFNKTVGEIHENLARINGILETMTSAASIRDEFGKIKLQLIVKIADFIYKLTNDSARRSSNNLKNSSTNLTYNPQHIAYCIEYFRNQLIKAKYLFSSLTLSASIGSSTLDNIVVKSLSTINLQQTSSNGQDVQSIEDITGIKKDILNLEEYIYLLNQRYANHIVDWQTLEDVAGGTTTMTGEEKLLTTNVGFNIQRLGVTPAAQKLSATSSTTSIERSSFCARLHQKCQIVCCICTPNYL
ncbi:unnamed protein product [Rotaria socialis]|uniref:Uncharacterized protein n=1 Tax=Rotaria socialis TaxID=392032 RepID=A0A817X5E7_9BILA|nr:unnamed protein product [Rotaria socialis]CAF3363824.1 unnamed protein product [Rotaria socialis]CAF3512060.1 unnamed protein product [Rotaria socialis]CAF3652246.1 unnamed protein product [Rotaria socialis]CAF3730255.1 unnamed protein product [Rotaria socialis]